MVKETHLQILFIYLKKILLINNKICNAFSCEKM